MALERTNELTLLLRSLLGDEYVRGADNVVITDGLTQDGEYTAQACANALYLAARRILNAAYRELGSADKVAAMFPEYVAYADCDFGSIQGQSAKYELPNDFGWLVSARFRPEGEKAYRVSLGDPLTHIDKLMEATNADEVSVPRGFIEGKKIVIAYTNRDGSFAHGDANTVQVRYIRNQLPVSVTGQDDILINPRWDTELIEFAKTILLSFKD